MKERLEFRQQTKNTRRFITGPSITKSQANEEYGINGGKISKLMLKANGEIICNYDRGWDIEPTCEAAELALAILLKSYN